MSLLLTLQNMAMIKREMAGAEPWGALCGGRAADVLIS